MAQRSHVPKFGNWDSEETVPYTAYFDKARKNRGGKMINPNDPEENPDVLSDNEAPAPARPSKTIGEPEKPLGQGAARARGNEDGDPKQFKNSQARQDDTNRRASAEFTHQRQGRVATTSGEAYKRPVKQGAGSENSFERSPLHNQARIAGRGYGDQSPSWEGKGGYKNSQGTPGRSRLRPTARGDESPDRGAAVPKFGEWDENNPASADGYTHIFNKVREERNSGSKTPGMPSPAPYYAQKPSTNDSAKCCCFPWGKS